MYKFECKTNSPLLDLSDMIEFQDFSLIQLFIWTFNL